MDFNRLFKRYTCYAEKNVGENYSPTFFSLLTNSPSETKNEKTQTNSPNDRIINPTPFTLIWI